MSDSTRFRPTSRFVVTRALWFTIVILLVTTFAILGRAVLARPGVPAGLPDVLKWTALISPVLFLSLVGVFYGFGAIWPVIVSRDGITCWTARGSKRLVRWCDIAKVNSFSASNIPMLRIELVGSRENV